MENKREEKSFTQLMNYINEKNVKDNLPFRVTWEYRYPIINGGGVGYGIKANVYNIDNMLRDDYIPLDSMTVSLEIEKSSYKESSIEDRLNDIAVEAVVSSWGPDSCKRYFI